MSIYLKGQLASNDIFVCFRKVGILKSKWCCCFNYTDLDSLLRKGQKVYV